MVADADEYDDLPKMDGRSLNENGTNTLRVGVLGTLLCLVIGIPMAYWMAVKVSPGKRAFLLALVIVPFWTNFLVRTIGWQVILAPEGWLSGMLQALGKS